MVLSTRHLIHRNVVVIDVYHLSRVGAAGLLLLHGSHSWLICTCIHDVIWFHRRRIRIVLICNSACRAATRIVEILWDHISVVLIYRVVLVPIGVDIHFVEFMVNFRFEKLFNHVPAILSRQLGSKPQQELVLVALSLLNQLPEGILEILHSIVPQLEQELHHVLSMLLLCLRA